MKYQVRKSKSELNKRLLKKGDLVKMIDGSSLTRGLTFPPEDEQPFYIVNSYVNITGEEETLDDIICAVIETDLEDFFCVNDDTIYPQDLKIRIGKEIFFTHSSMVTKV